LLPERRELSSAVRRIVFGACAIAIAACSTSSKGSGGAVTVTGTIDGHTVATTNAVGVLATLTSDGVTTTYAGVDITNFPGACAILATHGSEPANQAVLSIAVGVQGSTVPPGTVHDLAVEPGRGRPVRHHRRELRTDAPGRDERHDRHHRGGRRGDRGKLRRDLSERRDAGGTFSVPICEFDPNAQPDAAPECGS
jgi:hypothetical protein